MEKMEREERRQNEGKEGGKRRERDGKLSLFPKLLDLPLLIGIIKVFAAE